MISFRLPDREQRNLRRRATLAGLSVSAYTRRAVLEYEHLNGIYDVSEYPPRPVTVASGGSLQRERGEFVYRPPREPQ